MRIDPYNVAVTVIDFQITGNDEMNLLLVSRIQNRYQELWNRLDFQKELRGTEYGSTKDKYLRELVTLEGTGTGELIMKVIGQTEEESKKLASLLEELLQSCTEKICTDGYVHQLLMQKESSRIIMDEELLNRQSRNLKLQAVLKEEKDAAEKELRSLKEPTTLKSNPAAIVKSGIKYGILGMVFGLIIAMIAITINYLFRNRVETSRQLEQIAGIAFLGSFTKKGSCWDRAANRVLGERTWASQNCAVEYFQENAKIRVGEMQPVAVLSSCKIQETQETVQTVLNALKSQGLQPQFVGNALYAPETAACLQKSNCIILLEEMGVSRWTAVEDLLELAKEFKTPVAGFAVL